MAHHGASLRRLLVQKGWQESDCDELLDALKNFKNLDRLSTAEKAMLAYVRKLTQSPAKINDEDINRLRAVGFDDRAIHDICSIAAYFAFVNRIADGLGVELEDRFSSGK